MPTYLLTWNPKKWPWERLQEQIKEVEDQNFTIEPWSCGVNKSIKSGDKVFLVRLGEKPKGIVASGTVTKGSHLAPHYDEDKAKKGIKALKVIVKFDALFDAEKEAILPISILEQKFPGVKWTPQASGTKIKNEVIPSLENLWGEFVQNKDNNIDSPVDLKSANSTQKRFWESFIKKADTLTSLYDYAVLAQGKYLQIRLGMSGIHYSTCVIKNESWVELCIQLSAERSKEIFDEYYREKDVIEKEFGSTLTWDYKKGRERCKIMSDKISFGIEDENKWVVIQESLIDMIIHLNNTLGKRGILKREIPLGL